MQPQAYVSGGIGIWIEARLGVIIRLGVRREAQRLIVRVIMRSHAGH